LNKKIDPLSFADSVIFRLKFNKRMTMGSLVLLDLMGGVALLLWGLHMVTAESCARSVPISAGVSPKP